MSEDVYKFRGLEFRFNDPVEATMCAAADCVGRLVQVRRGCGQFGSDLYMLRRRDGSLHTFENVGLEPFTTEELPDDGDDSVLIEYTVNGGSHPHTGFIIESPTQPQTPGSFSILVRDTDGGLISDERHVS